MQNRRKVSKFTAMVLFLSLVMTLLFGQVVTARAATNDYLGHYTMESLMGLSLDTIAMATGTSVEEAKNMFTIDLQEDGVCLFKADDEQETIYWRAEGTTLMLSSEKDAAPELEGTIQDGEIILNVEGTELKLKKEGGAAAETGTTETGTTETGTTGTETAPEDISGVYRLNRIMGMDMQTYATLTGTTFENASNTWVMDVKPDGNAYMAVDGSISAIKWAREGDKIALVAFENGVEDRLEGTLSGDCIVLSVEGIEVILKRDPK